ncbi:MAG: aspartate-semialdehyde dehydrogenase [Dermatophilus congolensis]|nr:aspartate-semialdehyde dehydrogenase [Dermatophilus congolensis]
MTFRPEGAGPRLAVIGATGAVGSDLLGVLSVRENVWGPVRLFATPASEGKVRYVCGQDVVVESLRPEVFDEVDVAIFAAPPEVSLEWAPIAAEKGVIVIDDSPAFRMDPDVPLVVSNLNGAQIRNRPKGIIANPNCTVLTLMDALASLHSGWELQELVIATYQAASGVGRAGAARLVREVEVLAGQPNVGVDPGGVRRRLQAALADEPPSPFPGPLAFNVLPWAGDELGDGWSTEEVRLREETRKVLGLKGLKVSATCVRVPVVRGHSMVVHATFHSPITVEDARKALMEAPSVVLLDDPMHGEWPTPADIASSDPTFVGRVRQAPDFPHTLDLFISGDNLRKGGALNSAQIGELVCAELRGE